MLQRILFFFLLAPVLTSAQADIPDTALLNAQRRYNIEHYREKVFAHVNKTFFLAGEIIWFKLYAVSGGTNLPLKENSIGYIDLIGSQSQAVLSAKIPLDSGCGSGSISIPPFLPGGRYTLRAYTKWMRNTDPKEFYTQEIEIVNTLKPVEKIARPATPDASITLFPEGGDLVRGLASDVGFCIRNRSGKPVRGHGWVLSAAGDTVTRFSTGLFGMGRFRYTPSNNDAATVVFETGGSHFKEMMPAVRSTGFVMHLEPGEEKLRLEISTANQPGKPEVFVLIWQEMKIISAKAQYMQNGTAVFHYNKSDWPAGITHITVFDAARSPVAERLYFKPGQPLLKVAIVASQTNAGKRQKIEMSVNTTDTAGISTPSLASATVFQVDELQKTDGHHISEFLLLSGGLQGQVDSPSYYFDHPDPEVSDNLMLTHGWMAYRKDSGTAKNESAFDFLPESGFFVLQGKITSPSGTAVAGSGVSVTVPGRQFRFTTGRTDDKGLFRLTLPLFYGGQDLIIHGDSNTKTAWQPAFDESAATKTPEDKRVFSDSELALLESKSVNTQVQNSYRLAEKNQWFPDPDIDSSVFYGKPAKSYLLDDYTRFGTIEEVMREYVAEVRVRKAGNHFYFRLLNQKFNTFFEDDPLVLIDGFPVSDLNRIMAVNPLRIRSVDIIPERFTMGLQSVDGIVSYRSYDGEMAGFEINPSDVVLRFDGLQRQRKFYSPLYETDQSVKSPLPDMRNVLYWSPAVNTGASGENHFSFYSSDLPGTYVVLVEALGKNGLPGYGFTMITVGK